MANSLLKKFFGVKRIDEIKFEISENSELNELCTNDIKNALQKRYKYLLAMKCAEDEVEKIYDYAKILKKINIEIYCKCMYRVKKESEFQYAEEGDLLKLDSKLILCSKRDTYEASLKNPHFCESLVEALCLEMSISGGKWFETIRTILKNSIEENQYDYDKNFADTFFKESISTAFGISESEMNFWSAVSNKLGCGQFDEKKLVENGIKKTAYVDSVVGISGKKLPDIFKQGIPDIHNMTSNEQYALLQALGIDDASVLGECSKIHEYYKERIDGILQEYVGCYGVFLQKKINELEDKTAANDIYKQKVESFLDDIETFKCSDVINELPKILQGKVLSESDIEQAVRETIDKNFEFKSIELDFFKEQSLEVLSAYCDIMQKYNRSASDIKTSVLTYTYFEGFESIFEKKLIQENTRNTPPDHTVKPEPKKRPTGHVYSPEGWKVKLLKGKTLKGGPRGKRKPFARSGSLNESGKSAEEIALEWLEDQDEYEIVHKWSSNLNKLIVNGHDDKHRDLDYKKKGEDTVRYLEVKSFKSGMIHFSKEEYDFATQENDGKNKAIYDIALVDGDNVALIPHPFLNKDFTPEPESYVAFIELQED